MPDMGSRSCPLHFERNHQARAVPMGIPILSVLQLWTLLPSVGGFRLRQLRRFIKWKSYVLGEYIVSGMRVVLT